MACWGGAGGGGGGVRWGGGGYLRGKGSQPAGRCLAGSPGGLRHLAPGGQVSSCVGGVLLLAGEDRHRLILACQDAAPDL